MASQIEEVKSAVDIVQVIGERLHLMKAGKNLKALCPFHSEKTPSFFVTPEIQRYKCFGCGKSGDVITFLQEYDSLTFGEALEALAARAGITLERQTFTPEDARRKRLYEVLNLAKEYYHYLLMKHKLGEPARKYLAERGVTGETINTFELGYAVNSWDALQDYLIKKKGYTASELEDAGLIIRRSSTAGARDMYDRFRGRIMFPLADAQGRVVGFSGRVLQPDVKEAKYINSPETQLYHKSELLFGYSVLKNFLRKEEEVFVVEGELDALSSYQAGVKNVVAIKGSALTDRQLRLLSRTVKRVTLALDADSAGVEATKRAIEVAKPFELSLRVLPLSGGKDPDEIARDNPALWRDMTKKAVSVYEFLIDAAFGAHSEDKETGEGKRLITREIIPVLANIQNAVEQAHYLGLAARRLEVKQEALEKEVEKYQAKRQMPAGGSTMQKEEPLRGAMPTSRAFLERYLCGLLLHIEPEEIKERAVELQSVGLEEPAPAKILKHLVQFLNTHTMNLKQFSHSLPEELHQPLSDLYLEFDSAESKTDKEWTRALRRLKLLTQKEKMQEIAAELAQLEQKQLLTSEEEQRFAALKAEFVEASAAVRELEEE